MNKTKIHQSNTLNISVIAKDSAGKSVSSGGEIFIIKISNTCTKYNKYYCAPNGTGTTLSSNVNDVMKDNKNGTYTEYENSEYWIKLI